MLLSDGKGGGWQWMHNLTLTMISIMIVMIMKTVMTKAMLMMILQEAARMGRDEVGRYLAMKMTIVLITMIVMKTMTREEVGRMAVDAKFDNDDNDCDDDCDDHEDYDDKSNVGDVDDDLT